MTVKLLTGYGLRITYRGQNGKEKVRTKLLMPGDVADLPDNEAMELIDLGKAIPEVATFHGDDPAPAPGKNLSEGEMATEGQETARLDPDQLQSMTLAELKKLAEDMGLDTSDLRKKSDVIDLITAEDVYAVEDGEAPPDLNAEAPVV